MSTCYCVLLDLRISCLSLFYTFIHVVVFYSGTQLMMSIVIISVIVVLGIIITIIILWTSC